MVSTFRRSAAIGLTALGLSLAGYSAQAAVLTPQNLTFTQFNAGGGLTAADKNGFSAARPVGWTGGTGLIAIDGPNTATTFANGQYGVYGPFPNPPSGGNFIQADGNPIFDTTFHQSISGLTGGTTYTLSFWQAAGQQSGFSGATTEQWKVFLGPNPVTVNCSHSPCTVSAPGDFEADSTVMHTLSEGVVDWNQVNLSFVAPGSGSNLTETLTFLAWGDGGATFNEPPTVFLAGVNTPAVPEPATLSLVGVGLVGLGSIALRRRGKRSTSN